MTPEYIAKEKTRLQTLEQQYADMIRQFKESQAWKNVTSPVEKKDTRVVTIKPPRTSHIITEEKMTFSCGSDSEKDQQMVILPRRQRCLIDLSPSTKPDLTLPWNGVAAAKSRCTTRQRDRPDVVGKELSPTASAVTTNTDNRVTHTKNNSVGPGMMPGVASKPVVTAAGVAGTKAKVAGTNPNVEAGTKANVEAGTKPNVEAGTKANVEAGTKPNVEAGTKANVEAGTKANVEAGTKANVEAGTKPNVEAGTKANVEAGTKANVEAGTKPNVEAGTKANVEAGTKANVEAGTKANVEAGTKANVEAGTKANVEAGTKSKPKSVCKFSMPRGQQLETLKRLHVSLSFIALFYSETYVKARHAW